MVGGWRASGCWGMFKGPQGVVFVLNKATRVLGKEVVVGGGGGEVCETITCQ